MDTPLQDMSVKKTAYLAVITIKAHQVLLVQYFGRFIFQGLCGKNKIGHNESPIWRMVSMSEMWL